MSFNDVAYNKLDRIEQGQQASRCDTSALAKAGASHPSFEPPPSNYVAIKNNEAIKLKVSSKKSKRKTDTEVYLKLRTTLEIKTIVSKQAENLCISESEYIRRCILSKINKVDHLFKSGGKRVYIIDAKILSEISKIGNNLNQIAHALNSANLVFKEVYISDIFELLLQIHCDLAVIIKELKTRAEMGGSK